MHWESRAPDRRGVGDEGGRERRISVTTLHLWSLLALAGVFPALYAFDGWLAYARYVFGESAAGAPIGVAGEVAFPTLMCITAITVAWYAMIVRFLMRIVGRKSRPEPRGVGAAGAPRASPERFVDDRHASGG